MHAFHGLQYGDILQHSSAASAFDFPQNSRVRDFIAHKLSNGSVELATLTDDDGVDYLVIKQ
jgi:hypothetical protein